MVSPISSSDSDRTTYASPPEDVLYRILSVRRRRDVLRHLNDVEDRIELADLARGIALREADSDGDSLSSADLRCVHVSLYHVHVPKLAAANAVAFDRAERTVGLTEIGRAVVDELEQFTGQRE